MFEKILVCLDGSKLAEQILPFTEEQALRFNSTVTLLQVITSVKSEIISGGATYKGIAERTQQSRIRIEEAGSYLASIADSLKAKQIQVEVTSVESASVGDAIIKYAEANQHNLITIATHGHGGLGRLMFGSVADYVLRHSKIPILVIRPQNI